MKDYLGKDLFVDDYVVFIMPGYREFVKGRIIKFTNRNVRVKYLTSDSTVLQSPIQLIRITRR